MESFPPYVNDAPLFVIKKFSLVTPEIWSSEAVGCLRGGLQAERFDIHLSPNV